MSDTPRTDAKSATNTQRYGVTMGQFVEAEFARTLERECDSLQRELEQERELRIMQLAGISVASLQNTKNSIKDRIGKENPYCSQAYLDVCVAVNREMKLRQERDVLQRELDEAKTRTEHNRQSAELARYVLGEVQRERDELAALNAVLREMSQELAAELRECQIAFERHGWNAPKLDSLLCNYDAILAASEKD